MMTTEPEPTVELDAERLARIARLQARRSPTVDETPAPGSRRRRRHPARDSRIAATAIGVSALFGLVTAYGVAARDAGPELAEVTPVAPAQFEPIVIQLRLVGADGSPLAPSGTAPVGGAGTGSVPTTSVPAASAPAAAQPAAAPTAPEVRVLTAPAAAAPAPAAPAPVETRTSGSR